MSLSDEPNDTGAEQVRPEPAVPPTGKKRQVEAADRERADTAAPEEASIPWGYGVDRVGAMAVDPERLFVYWEITDDGIERARKRAGDADAPVVLRIYEVTGRIFDGTNAHSAFDHEIERAERQWFFDIHRPESEYIVELGLKTEADEFVKIVRSRRVEFPRAEPPAPSGPRWLTVRVHEGRPEPQPEPVQPSPGVHGDWPEPPRPAAAAQPTTPQPESAPGGPAFDASTHVEEPPPATFLTLPPEPVESHSEERRVFRWKRPAVGNSWTSGPSTTELETPAPWTEAYSGETRFYHDGPHTRVVTGPWEVVIRGLGAFSRREVLAQWEIHRSWITDEGSEIRRPGTGNGGRKLGSSELAPQGASERRWLAGSELRLSGSSERLYRGASERRLGGSSERRFRGGSERRLGGASEKLRRGASERRLGGASERLRRGASEHSLRPVKARPQVASTRVYPSVEDSLDDE